MNFFNDMRLNFLTMSPCKNGVSKWEAASKREVSFKSFEKIQLLQKAITF